MAKHSIPLADPRRRRAAVAFFAILPLWWAGCASLEPRHYTVSEAELARLMARHFPATQRVAEIADVTVSSPRLILLPERNRLGASFELSAKDRLFGKGLEGRMALDSGLRFEPTDDSIRLADVRVQQLDVDNAAWAGAALPVQRLGALLAEQLLEGLSVYQLKPEQARRLHDSGLKPHIAVTAQGLELSLTGD